MHPLERISLALVRADDLRKIIKWPILQLDSFWLQPRINWSTVGTKPVPRLGSEPGPEAVDPPAWFRSPTAF